MKMGRPIRNSAEIAAATSQRTESAVCVRPESSKNHEQAVNHTRHYLVCRPLKTSARASAELLPSVPPTRSESRQRMSIRLSAASPLRQALRGSNSLARFGIQKRFDRFRRASFSTARSATLLSRRCCHSSSSVSSRFLRCQVSNLRTVSKPKTSSMCLLILAVP